mgnify:CR=1 FL=1
MALKPGDGLDKWEIAVAKKVVGEFRRRSRILGREEFDDLVQDCLLHWIGVRRKLAPDPDEPPVGYMAQVLRNKLTDLMREPGGRLYITLAPGAVPGPLLLSCSRVVTEPSASCGCVVTLSARSGPAATWVACIGLRTMALKSRAGLPSRAKTAPW